MWEKSAKLLILCVLIFCYGCGEVIEEVTVNSFPVINLKYNETLIYSGNENVDFGIINVGLESATIFFQVENLGSSTLKLEDDVKLTGLGVNEFILLNHIGYFLLASLLGVLQSHASLCGQES